LEGRGLRVSAPTAGKGPRGRCVSVYEYRDERGVLVVKKKRFENKSFEFGRDRDGLWIPGADGIAVPLYRADELAKADAEREVWIAEGEKDADRLRSLGILATTLPFGALANGQRLRPSDLGALRRFGHFVITEDNDPSGREHVAGWSAALRAMGITDVRAVTFRDLPDKGDVSDWLELGHTAEELIGLAEAAPQWKPPAAAAEAAGGTRITRMSDVQPRRLSWLWRHRIPRGMVTVLAGSGGLGKSTVLLDIVARVTTGQPMPDGWLGLGEPTSVVIFTAEDALDSVVVPRLLLAGADLARIVTVGVKVGEGDERSLMVTPADLAHLEAVVRAEGSKLIVFDPILSYVAADVNMHHAQDARRILAWLHRLAERLGVAVVGIHHWNKSQSPDPSMRLSGSAAIGQAARSVLVVGMDPRDSTSERRVLTLDKKNLAPPSTPSLAYRLVVERHPDGTEGEHPRVEWLGASPVTSRDLAATPEDPDRRKVQREAEEWLRENLAEGPVPAAKAEAEGFDKRVMGRARKSVGVEVEQHARAWWWRLQKFSPDPWPWDPASTNETWRPEPPEQSQASPSNPTVSGRGQVSVRPEIRPDLSTIHDDGLGPPVGVRSSGPVVPGAQPEPTNDPARPTCPDCGGATMRWTFGTVCTSCHRQFQDPDRGNAWEPQGGAL